MTLPNDIPARWLLVYIDEPKFMQREVILKNPLSPKPARWYELHSGKSDLHTCSFFPFVGLHTSLPCDILPRIRFSTKGNFFLL